MLYKFFSLTVILLILLLSLADCAGGKKVQPVEKKNDNGNIKFQNGNVNTTNNSSSIKLALKNELIQSSFCGVIKQYQLVKDKSEKDIDKIIIQARVLETLKGTPTKNLQYEMFIEKGDDISLQSHSIIACLCYENGRYVWPGVGSNFPDDPYLRDYARKTVSELKPLLRRNCSEEIND